MKLNTIENRHATNLVINSRIASLTLFPQAEILEQIGRTRLARFLSAFADDLKAAGLDLILGEEGASLCFSTVAGIFSDAHSLPQRLYTAALTLEAAASPENDARLDEVIRRRLPCIGLNRNYPLDCALELWFACPDELPQFAPQPHAHCSSRGNEALNLGAPAPAAAPGVTESFPCPDTIGVSEPYSSRRANEANPDPSPSVSSGSASPQIENQNSKIENETARPSHLASLTSTAALLNELAATLTRYVVLPDHAADALALWIVHTYCFQFRDVSTYIGIESPVKRCGKTTLLSVLGKLVHKPVMASNISPSAFFRVIEEEQPTLLIDEADTFLQGNDELRGIFNAGYYKPNAYVIRVTSEPAPSRQIGPSTGSHGAKTKNGSALPSPFSPLTSRLARFSCWCPKVIAAIGHLPETLADRCIVIRMQRKRGGEVCERLRNLDAPASSASVLQNSKTPTLQHSQTPELSTAAAIRKLCARFALEHQHSITTATPQTPPGLNDRACDIWEPLLVIADIAGGHWPEKARAAAVAFTSGAQENSPSSTLLFDIGLIFILLEKERLFTSQIVSGLNCNRFAGRPWMEARKGKPVTEIWLSQQLRPFGVRPKNLRIGAHQGKGYELPDLQETFSRYVPSSEIDNFKAGLRSPVQPSAGAAESPEAG